MLLYRFLLRKPMTYAKKKFFQLWGNMRFIFFYMCQIITDIFFALSRGVFIRISFV